MAAGDLVDRPGHIQYGGLLLGPGTPYQWENLTGWDDLPALDSGTVPRPAAHGSYPGPLFSQSRVIGLTGLIIRAPVEQIGAVAGAVTAATGPVVDELPLVVWLDDRGPLLAYARAVRRSVPVALYRVGLSLGGAIEWEATDPRRYSLSERSASASLPAAEPGLDWHTDPEGRGGDRLDWPLEFGAPGSTGAMTATNAGGAETHPVIEFRGPVVRPSVTNIRTGDVLEYDIPLAADDVLVVDTRAGTVTLNETASRLSTVTSRSAPEQAWTLPPGTSDLFFRAAPGSVDPAARCTIRYRSAYW
ncbi:phage tail domain-containing protein [Streptomyces sp. TP-A0875]|uniref:phage distal tail protein n=1 Tax=Streptomyces sp. TP-A0875 TaxID=552354 RepID=UPI000B02CF65|nr:phage tail domain-containing protein [Streptomyces sp. TP-A0875]